MPVILRLRQSSEAVHQQLHYLPVRPVKPDTLLQPFFTNDIDETYH